MFNTTFDIKNKNITGYLTTLILGFVVPFVIYFILPTYFHIDMFASKISMDVILNWVIFLLIGLAFAYIAYLGGTRYFAIPICALFMYQTLHRALSLYYPSLHLNFRAIILSFILPVLFFAFTRHKFNKELLKPYLPVFVFCLLNVLYAIIGFMHVPNSVYNMEQYTVSANAIIPRSFGIELAIFMLILGIAIYLSNNIFRFESRKALSYFNKFIVIFLLSISIFSVSQYFLGDIKMINILAGVKRLMGFSTHTNIYAFFNGCIILFVSYLLYSNEFKDKAFFKYLSIFTIAISCIATFLTYSRSINLLLGIILFVNMFLLTKNKVKFFIGVALTILAGFIVLTLLQTSGAMDIISAVNNRLADDGSSEFRPRTWEYLYSQIQWDWHLLFGQGIGAVSSTLFNYFSSRYFTNNEPIIYHPHNSFFHVFFDYGIVGLLSYFGSIIYLFKVGIGHLRTNNVLNITALFLIELILFALVASIVDSYLFNFEMLPFWIIITILYTQINPTKTSGISHV